ncbi:MAG: hypothetical protein ACLFWB_08825, partial [Armatimonadota bacterium]
MKRISTLYVVSLLITVFGTVTAHAATIPSAQIPPPATAPAIDGEIQGEWQQAGSLTAFSQVGLNR